LESSTQREFDQFDEYRDDWDAVELAGICESVDDDRGDEYWIESEADVDVDDNGRHA
jgi:hypothetical protein